MTMSDDKAIWEYARDGDLNGVKSCVELKGKDVILNERDPSSGDTALMCAVEAGHLPVVQYLVSQCSAVINETNSCEDTALVIAAERGHLPILDFLVRSGGASVSDSDAYGCSALMLASREGHLSVVQYLLANGAAVNHKSEDGSTALMYACFYGQLSIVRWLLLKGAASSVNDQDNEGNTALHWACNFDPESTIPESTMIEIIKTLIANDADSTITNARGNIPADSLESELIRARLSEAVEDKGTFKNFQPPPQDFSSTFIIQSLEEKLNQEKAHRQLVEYEKSQLLTQLASTQHQLRASQRLLHEAEDKIKGLEQELATLRGGR